MKQQLSPRDLGAALGVSESSMKRWIDEGRIRAHRTPGGHRRIDRAEAIRFIRQSGLAPARPGLLGLEDGLPAGGEEGDLAVAERSLYAALIGGTSQRVRSILQSLYLAGHPVASLCDGPLARAMGEVGQLWHEAPSGVYLEHRATDLALQALDELRALLPPPARTAPVAVGGAPSGDPYLLPSLAAATTLASEGWRDVNLGPHTPLDALDAAAEDMGARLVWLSVSVAGPAGEFGRRVRALARRLAARGGCLAVGGSALPRDPGPGEPGLWVGRSMAELAAFAGGLAAARE